MFLNPSHHLNPLPHPNHSFSAMQTSVEDLVCSGYPGVEILKALSSIVVASPLLDDSYKAKVCVKIGRADKTLVEGADETLQIMDVGGNIIKAFEARRN